MYKETMVYVSCCFWQYAILAQFTPIIKKTLLILHAKNAKTFLACFSLLKQCTDF